MLTCPLTSARKIINFSSVNTFVIKSTLAAVGQRCGFLDTGSATRRQAPPSPHGLSCSTHNQSETTDVSPHKHTRHTGMANIQVHVHTHTHTAHTHAHTHNAHTHTHTHTELVLLPGLSRVLLCLTILGN